MFSALTFPQRESLLPRQISARALPPGQMADLTLVSLCQVYRTFSCELGVTLITASPGEMGSQPRRLLPRPVCCGSGGLGPLLCSVS